MSLPYAILQYKKKTILERINTMKKFNPEILSNKPTHYCPAYGMIKVFTDKRTFTDSCGRVLVTAEIMEGDKAGKWTTVYQDSITKL